MWSPGRTAAETRAIRTEDDMEEAPSLELELPLPAVKSARTAISPTSGSVTTRAPRVFLHDLVQPLHLHKFMERQRRWEMLH